MRDWLNTFQYSVKKSPVETAFFRYLVTVDSGTRMLIGRTKNEYEEYVQIRSDMSPGAEDRKSVEALNDLEKAIVLGEIRLEVARRQVGYQNLTLAAETFYIHKRIPIRETLTEHEFIAAIDEVEAAVHAVQLAFALAVAKTGKYQLPETRTIEGV